MLARSSLVLVGIALLSGCAAPEELHVMDTGARIPTDDELPPDDAAEFDAGAPPQWRLGEWWTYDVEYVTPPQRFEMTIVVHGQEGSDWLLSGTDRTQNIHAEFSHYPTLGAWSKDLEATIHGFKIPFFKWPLKDGKTWEDPYRDIPATWSAKAAQVETPGGKTFAGFDLSMQAADGQYANYSYTPAAGWFTKLEQGFGSPAVRMTLKEHGYDFGGKVSVLAFTEHVHRSLPVLAAQPGAGAPGLQFYELFDVKEGASLAWGFYYGGSPGQYSFAFQPDEAGEGVNAGGQTTDGAIHAVFGEVKAPKPGQWAAAGGGAAQGFGFAFGELLEVHDVE